MMDLLAVAQTDSHTLNHTKSLARGSSRFQYTLHTETKSDQWAGRPHYAWMAPSRAFHRAGARVRSRPNAAQKLAVPPRTAAKTKIARRMGKLQLHEFKFKESIDGTGSDHDLKNNKSQS